MGKVWSTWISWAFTVQPYDSLSKGIYNPSSGSKNQTTDFNVNHAQGRKDKNFHFSIIPGYIGYTFEVKAAQKILGS